MEEQDPKTEEMDLIYDNDLLPVLEKLGVREDFELGKLNCAICGKTITQENLSAFYMEQDQLKLVCDSKDCIEKVTNKNQS